MRWGVCDFAFVRLGSADAGRKLFRLDASSVLFHPNADWSGREDEYEDDSR